MADYNNDFNNLSGLDISSGKSTSDYTSPRIKRVNFNTFSSRDYATSEAFKTLRTNIFFCGSDVKTIMLTSCDENEGKNTVSLELAKSLAEYGKRAILIDADMRKSVMLRRNPRSNEIIGVSEVLSGLADISEAVYHTQDSNFDVIFAGRFPPNPVELIGNGKFLELLEALKKSYDYIIIDTPPLGLVIDAAEIARFCDGTVLVVRNGKVNRNTALRIKAQLERTGCRILGAVLNETENSRHFSKKYYYSGEYR